MSVLLDVKNLSTHFFTRAGLVPAVNEISFSLKAGQVLGLVGESGSGKTVTGLSLMGLVDPPGRIVSGSIKLEGQELVGLSEAQWRTIRGNRIAMIFQDPMMTLNPVLRIETQMMETIKAHETLSDEAARQRCIEALGRVGIPSPEERLSAYPHQFSGGMRQRVVIAIALLLRPSLIIADEPTTALDVTIQAQIIAEVQKLAAETGTAIVWVTHDLAVVSGLSDRLAVMYAGRIIEEGATDQVLSDPRHPYTQGLLHSLPINNQRGGRLTQIPGATPSLLNLPDGCAFAPRCAQRQSDCERGMIAQTLNAEGRRWTCLHPVLGGAH